jgi:phosphatidylglycerophosphatase A
MSMPEPRSTLESSAAGTRLAVSCATVLGIGLLRPAPGTWASLAAGLAAFGLVLLAPPALVTPVMLAGVALATLVGMGTAASAARHFGQGDPGPVVIDEVAGAWLAIALVPAATLLAEPLWGVLLPVLLFRVFDIAKPWPVGWFERLPGAFGIMADDLAAGVLAGFLALALLH